MTGSSGKDANPFDGAVVQTVLFAFDLAGMPPSNFPHLLDQKLTNAAVRKAMESALHKFLLKRDAAGTTLNQLTGKDALDLLTAINKGSARLEAADLKKIQASDVYKSAGQTATKLQNAVQSTPMGVWIDKHSEMLFISGVALTIIGGAVLYCTKSSGVAPKLMAGAFKGKKLQVLKVGKFKIQGQMLAFQPDQQILGGGLVFTERWWPVQTSLSLGIVTKAGHISALNGSLVFKAHPFDLSLKASDDPLKTQAKFGLSLTLNEGALKSLKIGFGAVVTKGVVTGEDLSASMKTGIGHFSLKAGAKMLQPAHGSAFGPTEGFHCVGTWSVHF